MSFSIDICKELLPVLVLAEVPGLSYFSSAKKAAKIGNQSTSLHGTASSHDLYSKLLQPTCVSKKKKKKCEHSFPSSTSALTKKKYADLVSRLFEPKSIQSLDIILPIRSNAADNGLYEEFLYELDEKVGHISVVEIYNNQRLWSSLTDQQFGFVSKVHSVLDDGLEVRVDDLIGFLLESLKFTSPPRPMNTSYLKGKVKVKVTEDEKVGYEAAREIFRQGKVKVGGVNMSSTPDLAYYIFGEFSELPTTDKTCTLVIENKRNEVVTNAVERCWNRQIYGEMLIHALRNYELVCDDDAVSPPFYPMYGIRFHGTTMSLFYAAFSPAYLEDVKNGHYPARAEVVYCFNKIKLPVKTRRNVGNLEKLDLSGTYTQRQACIDILLRLKAYSRCLGGYEDYVLLEPPTKIDDHRGTKSKGRRNQEFLFSYEGFDSDDDDWIAYKDVPERYKDDVDAYWECIN